MMERLRRLPEPLAVSVLHRICTEMFFGGCGSCYGWLGICG